MDIAEVAKKVDALQAELAAKDSRIADLEARVSLLEAESARLRRVMPEGDAMYHTGKNGLTFGRLEEGFEGNKQKPVDMLVEHVDVVNDVIEVSDGKEDGMSVDSNKGKSAEEGVPAVPTPVKCAVRVVACGDDEDDAKGAGGGDYQSQSDDLSSVQRRKKRKSAIVISDSESEDEDENVERHGNEEGDEDWEGIGKEEGDEDDGKTTPEVNKKMREERSRDDGEFGARRALEFSEPKDHEESEDGSEEADSSADFIDDADCSETSPDSAEEYSAEPEESDNELGYKDAIDHIGRKRNADTTEWAFEGDMLSAFAKQPELCLKAVCALYRKQTEEEQVGKATIVHNKKGFSQIHARRGSDIAQFLLDGDASGHLKKTVQDLEEYDRYGLKFCHKIASHYSKQLFAIYQNQEDPYFP
uniref:Uncharacterized protein n=1 Tax=Avena sativa TaxID=4498 RepID=A0ACD5VUQ9_AVESA